MEGVGHPGPETGPTARSRLPDLGPFVVGHHPDLRPEAIEQPGPLPGAEDGRSGHVEAELDPGVHLVGVLAAGAPARAEPELQFGQGDGAAKG